MTITASRAGVNGAVLALTGHLDHATAPTLLSSLLAQVDAGRHHAVLDLAELRSCDSAGADALVALKQLAESAGGRLVLTAIRGSVQRELERAGLIGVIRTTITRRDALAALGLGADASDA
ncbi:STAS domain-containing protein [Amycolatopsis tucumanensis]|uniref:STAS domain-containing protein n=1 Tax=Amycolatopsis tucumanensis TaxID=401106 RepID=UPI001F15E0F5|nr:STAS domain-containing protein [Amycolatopsis tucumanensis]